METPVKVPVVSYPVPLMQYSPEHQDTTAFSEPSALSLPKFRPVASFRDRPVECDCSNCQAHVITMVKSKAGLLTFVLIFVIFLFGFVTLGVGFFLCWIPLVVPGVKDVLHLCPNCRFTIAEFKRLA